MTPLPHERLRPATAPAPRTPRKRERGAILVIALALLGLLATLTVLAMQTTALDLQLADSERARLRAFAAGELCLGLLADSLRQLPPGALPPDIAPTTVPDFPDDRMQCQAREIGADAATALGDAGLTGRHYTLLASGSSTRGATAALEQGLLVVRDAGGAVANVERSYWLRLNAD